MIIILGGNGYVGTQFKELLQSKGVNFVSLSRSDVDYSNVDELEAVLRSNNAEFLINAAGYTGRPNVDACELDKSNCLFGNAVLPGIIAEACQRAGIAWGHVSSGCIYTGSRSDGSGFDELDPPNFSFRQNNCSFYSGTKALGEEILTQYNNVYIWRLRIPFDHRDGARNYITKLLRYDKLLNAENSISHLGEFVASCFACWEKQIPFGIYNVTNPGVVSTKDVVELIKKHNLSDKDFQFFDDETEFMAKAAVAPRSNCTMKSDKLASYGITMTPVLECLSQCMEKWLPESK